MAKRIDNFFLHWDRLFPGYLLLIVILVGGILFLPSKIAWFILIGILFLFFVLLNFRVGLLFAVLLFLIIPRYLGFDLGRGMPIINVQRILLGVLYIVWFLNKSIKGEKFITRTPLNFPILILFCIQGLATIFAYDIHSSVKNLGFYLFEHYLLYFMILDTFRTKEQVKKLINTVLASGVIICLLGVVEFITQYNVFSPIVPVREIMSSARIIQMRFGLPRVEVSFGHAIALGTYLVLLIPLCLWKLRISRVDWKRFFWYFSFILFIFVLFATLSRGTWLGFFIAGLLLLGLWKTRFFCYLIPIILIGIIVLLQPWFFSKQIDQVKLGFIESIDPTKLGSSAEQNAEYISSSEFRLYLVKKGLPFTFQRPLVGYGLKNISFAVEKWSPGLGGIDNYYLNVVFQAGYFALLMVSLILVIIIKTLWNYSRKTTDRENKLLAEVLFSTIIGFCFVLLTSSLSDPFFLLWILAAISMRLKINQDMEYR